MSSKRSTTTAKKTTRASPAQTAHMVKLLERLVRLTEADTSRMLPPVDDIPKTILPRNRVFACEMSQILGNISVTSTGPINGAYYFALSGIDGYASWTSSFDAYRILKVYIEFNSFGIDAAANSTLGTFTTAIDYVDATPTDRMTLLQSDTAMEVPSGSYFERRIKPRTAVAKFNGAFTGYGQDTEGWNDCSSPAIQYYGLKYAASASSSANTIYSPVCTYLVQFKNNN